LGNSSDDIVITKAINFNAYYLIIYVYLPMGKLDWYDYNLAGLRLTMNPSFSLLDSGKALSNHDLTAPGRCHIRLICLQLQNYYKAISCHMLLSIQAAKDGITGPLLKGTGTWKVP
jgi:hypothetical protein